MGRARRRATLDVRTLLRALAQDDTALVELTEVDGVLHALVAVRGRVRHLDVGTGGRGAKAVDFALFTLRQAARGRRTQLEVAGARLQRAVLGPALDAVGGGTASCCPGPSRLQGVPWGLLPALAERPFTARRPARLWLRAAVHAASESDRRVMLVGPGLGQRWCRGACGGWRRTRAEVLDGTPRTVAASLAALDGAALAHVAAHGHFREDSPMFSSLTLADGPLLVHDLQGLRRPRTGSCSRRASRASWRRWVTRSCSAWRPPCCRWAPPVSVSSLAEVDDAATVEVMVALHASLPRRGRAGEALLAARPAAAGDPVLAATAASFTVLGI